MNKKIIYYGDFIEKYSTERYIAHAFREIGYDVLCLQEERATIGNAKQVLDEIKQLAPEFILFSKQAPGGDIDELMKLLKENKIKTVCWLFDLYFDLPHGDREKKLKEKKPPYNSDVLVSTDGGHSGKFFDLNINHICVRQGIHEPEAILYERKKTHDIIFVGGDHFRNRGWLLDGLAKHYGSAFEHWGFPVQIRNLPLNELYASTKIVVGDSQPSPHYWSNRIYETLGRGGFLIHPKVAGLEKEFEDGKHLVLYDRGNMPQLYDLIDYYLKNSDEREKIRRAGFEHVKNNYTYKHRVQELCNLLWKKEQQ